MRWSVSSRERMSQVWREPRGLGSIDTWAWAKPFHPHRGTIATDSRALLCSLWVQFTRPGRKGGWSGTRGVAPRVNDCARGEGLRRRQCERIAFGFGERERQTKRGKGEVYTGNTRRERGPRGATKPKWPSPFHLAKLECRNKKMM